MSWTIDKNKALEKFLKSYRLERDKKFQQLDVDFMKSLETDDLDSKNNIVSKKNDLRNFPSLITTGSFETVDELHLLWPNDLLDKPRSW